MQDIEYQLKKATKTPTDPKTMVSEDYHKFLNVFSKKASDTLSEHSKYDHRIQFLEDYKDHSNCSLQAMSKQKLQFVKKFLEKNLKKRFIKASSASCLSSIMLAVKLEGSVRFCIDYRKLNKLTVKNTYSISLIKETPAQLRNTKVFTKIDIWQAFHKLQMAADSKDYTTFLCRFGAFKCKVLLFGLMGWLASWQRFINNVLWEYLNKFCTTYLNNILIYNNNLREHKEHVRQVLIKLCKFGIQADMNKCEFYVTETKYLGLIISTKRIKINLEKVAAICNWDKLICVKETYLFIGFYNFYQRFIYRFSNMASLLNAMTKKKAIKKQFAWTNECKKAFQELKNCVCKAFILCYFNPSKQYFMETNFSNYINAGILFQLDDKNVLHLIVYFFRKMAPAECNYKIYNKELLAIIWCFEEW